jgi:hypothetical protein
VMQVIGDIIYSVGETPPARRSRYRISNARVSSKRGVYNVFELITCNAAVRLNCNRRVSYSIELVIHVPQVDIVVG